MQSHIVRAVLIAFVIMCHYSGSSGFQLCGEQNQSIRTKFAAEERIREEQNNQRDYVGEVNKERLFLIVDS